LFHLEVLLDLGNIAYFGVVDLTKFSIVSLGKLAKLLVANRKWKSRRRCRLFLSNFVPPESSFRSRKYGLFGVVDSTKFSIVAYAEIGQTGWLSSGSGNRAIDVGCFLSNFAPPGSSFWFSVVDLTKFSKSGYWDKLASCKPEVEIAPSTSGIFCRILFRLKVLLDLGNMAWLGVVDLTKLAGCEPEFEIAPSMSVIFCLILFRLAFLLDLGNMAHLAWSTRRSLALWPMGEIDSTG